MYYNYRDRRMKDKDRDKERDRDKDRERSRKDRDSHRRDKDRSKRSRFVNTEIYNLDIQYAVNFYLFIYLLAKPKRRIFFAIIYLTI